MHEKGLISHKKIVWCLCHDQSSLMTNVIHNTVHSKHLANWQKTKQTFVKKKPQQTVNGDPANAAFQHGGSPKHSFQITQIFFLDNSSSGRQPKGFRVVSNQITPLFDPILACWILIHHVGRAMVVV